MKQYSNSILQQLSILVGSLFCLLLVVNAELSPFYNYRVSTKDAAGQQQQQQHQRRRGLVAAKQVGGVSRQQLNKQIEEAEAKEEEGYEYGEYYDDEYDELTNDNDGIEGEEEKTDNESAVEQKQNLRKTLLSRDSSSDEAEVVSTKTQRERELGKYGYKYYDGYSNNNNKNSNPEDYWCDSFYAKSHKKSKKDKKSKKGHYYHSKKDKKGKYYDYECKEQQDGGKDGNQNANPSQSPPSQSQPTPSGGNVNKPPSPHPPKDFLRFIMVREEAGTPVPGDFSIGDTLALNGKIYYWDDYERGLISDTSVGSFVTLCTGINAQDDLLCKYEIVIGGLQKDSSDATGIGALIANGPNYQSENYMIITGTEFEFSKYSGGTLVTTEDLVNPYLYADLYLL
ncbi:hypothetical protein FRACYDRAFT_237406 [Fragilariopsis cylindrus CCMP1102]|uniref:Uncharacterized protein n=1 Tax=Fragilariopsis cylindrus CCMP1102 TaxID=635003 RepID=A0A1E7FMU5_9STRA|nr:hypothetical protein FRACYDRAFT_237406 [Fragilariopsis cylindrus CCMP1102]|eukprot:OEU19113.1 hypothetical protein FRACYDRAFT_237406 [Fragilariopsis cylindrus CCMP1102]